MSLLVRSRSADGFFLAMIVDEQFIKFFAWIEQWKDRAADARRLEMNQLIRCELDSRSLADVQHS